MPDYISYLVYGVASLAFVVIVSVIVTHMIYRYFEKKSLLTSDDFVTQIMRENENLRMELEGLRRRNVTLSQHLGHYQERCELLKKTIKERDELLTRSTHFEKTLSETLEALTEKLEKIQRQEGKKI